MGPSNTEKLHPSAWALDSSTLPEAATILAAGQAVAARVCMETMPKTGETFCGAARAMADTIRSGHCLHYVAAGSSGLMAASDAMELGGTFSIPAKQVQIHMAGGIPQTAEMPGDTEDATEGLQKALSGLTQQDTVIAVSASGTTPYTLAAVAYAQKIGATVIGIANNLGSTLLQSSTFAIALETPPEVIAGSTRLGAGTAQKIALNTLSSLMAIELGHVHAGQMVNLKADNAKLHARALRMVCSISYASEDTAQGAIAMANGDVKLAILLAAGAKSLAQAKNLLQGANGHLRVALKHLK